MREKASDGFLIEEFLTQKEFDLIRKIFTRHSNWNEVGEVSKYHGFGLDTEYGPILKWLVPRINEILTGWKVDFITLQESIIPWKVHADLRWYEKEVPHKMLLIPIDVVPETGEVDIESWPETYTITFKQRNYFSSYEKKTSLGSVGNSDLYIYPKDDPNVENLIDGYSITLDQWQKYFTHMPYEFLEGLELDAMIKWKPRSILGWDMTALHCADDFLAHRIKTKKCLMVCTVLDV